MFRDIEQLLLGYLPADHALWSYELEKKRSQYNAFREELLANPVSCPKHT
jgi:TBC1 domain family member 13